MKTCNCCGLEKPLSDFYTRSTGEVISPCRECVKAKANLRAANNREKVRSQNRFASAKWRESNRDRERARLREFRARNKDKARSWESAWRKANPDKRSAAESARRARQRDACVSWADRKAIQSVFRQAKEATRQTGVLHHVDHIVPLKSARVCGLHWEGNLRVLPATENIAKHNRDWPHSRAFEE